MEKLYIRMSSSGDCPRALSAKLLGYKPEAAPPWLETSAKEGNWHEQRIRNKLAEEGFAIDHSDKPCKKCLELFGDSRYGNHMEWEIPSFILIGHNDGEIIKAPVLPEPLHIPALLEIKSMSQYEFDRWMRGRWEEFPAYAAQVSCYMTAKSLKEALFIVKNRNSGYEDRSILRGTPQFMTKIIANLTTVSNAIISQTLAGGIFDPNSIECRRCFYKSLCTPSEIVLTPVEEKSLDKAVELYRLGKNLEKEAEENIAAAREILNQHMEYTKLQQYRHKGMLVSLITYKESVTYPKAKLLKAFTVEQLAPVAEIKQAYTQLRITDLEEQK